MKLFVALLDLREYLGESIYLDEVECLVRIKVREDFDEFVKKCNK